MSALETDLCESGHRLDCLFDSAIDALEELEKSRVLLHNSLREAHFSFSNAQREMDHAGLLLGWPAVPVAGGSVQPRLGVVQRVAESDTKSVDICNKGDQRWFLVNMTDPVGIDPVHWFAVTPSAALLECKQEFRGVLDACVEVVSAQETALAAAAAYSRAAQSTT